MEHEHSQPTARAFVYRRDANLLRCTKCGGQMEICRIDLHDPEFGHKVTRFVGYCTKGLRRCRYWEAPEHIRDIDAAAAELQRQLDERWTKAQRIRKGTVRVPNAPLAR